MKRKVYRSKPIPQFDGATEEERLQQMVDWSAENEPGREFTCEEIASVAGFTRQAVLVIQARALKKLRMRINKELLWT